MIVVNPNTQEEKSEKHFLVTPMKGGICLFKKDGDEIVQRINLSFDAVEAIYSHYQSNETILKQEQYGE